MHNGYKAEAEERQAAAAREAEELRSSLRSAHSALAAAQRRSQEAENRAFNLHRQLEALDAQCKVCLH